jgi:hypothetical protein
VGIHGWQVQQMPGRHTSRCLPTDAGMCSWILFSNCLAQDQLSQGGLKGGQMSVWYSAELSMCCSRDLTLVATGVSGEASASVQSCSVPL